ncbi:MAG: hypothetical protein A3J10_01305 [Candidatus Sungbacteria bacterium RIFCSPLOWO2_02_FULL_54_10]|uniref:GtrA/DPMS transmembrane domain-containing protein n=2 Tax=Candidatus Sungiibacteriota TaxID=1817917 RepID=A0A1G2L6V4_9BACT|nr:MAG: hypothetical protein A2679_03780 [Candidatus Sungbacteria bacterium RIFCSPHIGHO2_01_FULL_54_26]OHA02594.1 MAG: hypothetical protein A3C92_03040 [Candidatus Sungbacteria bacterium RIFCSPHIGHO2_02_FULL_53_17]OHA07393.1 MAG: hypothetical protein A3B34_02975 [Candidatus Sungbacteria bacterium RIFCSPLOWO2_01_FULL_54_21]OHA13252.1 MAG: hypothetical protein A3J10_01305 [Candidatus Sungbacteria bacterium RIFCSPLOWO2_02_FULL_54_10]
MPKTDYAIGSLIGFFAGIFAIPTFYNLGIKSAMILLAVPWAGAVGGLVGIWTVYFFARKMPVLAQFGRFFAVGVLNTVIDFGILNLLSRSTGIAAGFLLGGVNVPGFLVAVINSYLWNKLWVFKTGSQNLFAAFPRFFAVTLAGLLTNSAIVIFFTTYVAPSSGMAPNIALNIGKLLATAISLAVNFLGYKFFVFQKKEL